MEKMKSFVVKLNKDVETQVKLYQTQLHAREQRYVSLTETLSRLLEVGAKVATSSLKKK